MAQSACPTPAVARRIASTFSESRQKRLGKAPTSAHPRDVDRIWRLAGGNPGTARLGIERVVREAASLGVLNLGLCTVVYRWEA